MTTEAVCTLRGVTKSYGPHIVMSDFSLTVARGETLGLTGPSGAGKSTVLNLIGMLERPNAGDITLCGTTNPRLDSRAGRRLLREKVAYLFQNYALVDDGTVRVNLEIPLAGRSLSRRQRDRRMAEALEQVGLQVSLAQPVASLSGGEQQRVAFARLLLRPAELILADEPTGSLDPASRDAILGMLQERHEAGVSIVIASHEPAVLAICQRSVSLGRNHPAGDRYAGS